MPWKDLRERKVIMLIPYVLLVCLYLCTFHPFLHLPPEDLIAAITKAAPIWYLAAYVGLTPGFGTKSLAHGILAGLVLSSIGDVCLIWRTSLFLAGMFSFALAQSAYIYGLKSWLRRGNYPSGRYVRESFVLCSASYMFLVTGMDSWLMAACVLVYSALVFTMANLAVQRHLVEGNLGSYYGAVGGVFFALSDFLIGVDKWKWSFPMSEGVIMVTYYIAQGAIAFGAVTSARAKRRE
ncbi:hypothetical protein ACOMHN_042113 [Nucella lapillus]